MSFYRPLKIVLLVAVTVFLFLGDITSTFSFKRESDRNIRSNPARSFVYRITDSVTSFAETHAIDSIFNSYFSKNKIKGASIAVTKKGKLVYARGFGFSNYLDSTLTEPWNLFRIASVSKLITAAAIMKLCENGQLDLEDKVFGPSGWLNDPEYLQYPDKRVERITVRHLLTHTSGWHHKRFDPAFAPLVVSGKFREKGSCRVGRSYTVCHWLST